VCVAVVLGDALHRVSVLGGREGMARSLGSVYGGSVTRFLGGSLRGVQSRVIAMPGVQSWSNGLAVSRDGATLLVSDSDGGSRAIHVFRVADGSCVSTLPRPPCSFSTTSPYPFAGPRQLSIAPDDFVFVADFGVNRVRVLTPTLEFHTYVGADAALMSPSGVCACADIIVVSERDSHRISVFNRGDGALLRQFGCAGSGDGQLHWPLGLCFVSNDRHVAVVDRDNDRVSVFSVEGEFVRHVGVGALKRPYGVACSAFDELVVADRGNSRVAVFSGSGELMQCMGCDLFSGVAIHGGTIFAQDRDEEKCVVFT
jgi:DNA-binding beta-propeller fold protein YncE